MDVRLALVRRGHCGAGAGAGIRLTPGHLAQGPVLPDEWSFRWYWHPGHDQGWT
jgi:hypothetical protein